MLGLSQTLRLNAFDAKLEPADVGQILLPEPKKSIASFIVIFDLNEYKLKKTIHLYDR